MSDDRRYMTFEERAVDDPRYRGKLEPSERKAEVCYCGKTVYRSKTGARVSDSCPRNCEAERGR